MSKTLKISVAAMREHIDSLIGQRDIIVRWIKRPMRAYAITEAFEIFIPPVKSEVSYATALHEIGHLLGRDQYDDYRMVREIEAWIWARENALVWTPRMVRNAVACLDWYEARIGNLGGQSWRPAQLTGDSRP